MHGFLDSRLRGKDGVVYFHGNDWVDLIQMRLPKLKEYLVLTSLNGIVIIINCSGLLRRADAKVATVKNRRVEHV